MPSPLPGFLLQEGISWSSTSQMQPSSSPIIIATQLEAFLDGPYLAMHVTPADMISCVFWTLSHGLQETPAFLKEFSQSPYRALEEKSYSLAREAQVTAVLLHEVLLDIRLIRQSSISVHFSIPLRSSLSQSVPSPDKFNRLVYDRNPNQRF